MTELLSLQLLPPLLHLLILLLHLFEVVLHLLLFLFSLLFYDVQQLFLLRSYLFDSLGSPSLSINIHHRWRHLITANRSLTLLLLRLTPFRGRKRRRVLSVLEVLKLLADLFSRVALRDDLWILDGLNFKFSDFANVWWHVSSWLLSLPSLLETPTRQDIVNENWLPAQSYLASAILLVRIGVLCPDLVQISTFLVDLLYFWLEYLGTIALFILDFHEIIMLAQSYHLLSDIWRMIKTLKTLQIDWALLLLLELFKLLLKSLLLLR